MRDPQKNKINIDPATVVLIIAALILLPLLATGFLSQ
jgi:preprotein translocase subunit Sec61beta